MVFLLSHKHRRKKPKGLLNHKRCSLKGLKILGRRLLSSKSHINNLPILLSFISPSSPTQHVIESIICLHPFFVSVLPDLPRTRSQNGDSKESDVDAIYGSWLRAKFDIFTVLLINIALCPESEDKLKEIVMDTLFEFVRLGNHGTFQWVIFRKLLNRIVFSTKPIEFLLELLASKHFKYADVRFFTYVNLEKFAKAFENKDAHDFDKLSSKSIEFHICKIYRILCFISPLEQIQDNSNYAMWSSSGFLSKEPDNEEATSLVSMEMMRKKIKLWFTRAWVSFLRLPLPVGVYIEVLGSLHHAVLPYLANPVILCDFLTRSYDVGGVVSVMALSSLLTLITEHGLEYPNFYERLYALLEPSIFLFKYRAKFFQLLDSCLKSPLLPAYLTASFAKKLSRLSLVVSPSGAMVIIALIHNLLRRHPSINCLVHREGIGETNNDDSTETEMAHRNKESGLIGLLGVDHFDNDEPNPLKSNALRSSLWEIDALRHHYLPSVSSFVLSLEKDLTARSKTTIVNISDFSSGSYASLFEEEMKRKMKRKMKKEIPLSSYSSAPSTLFSPLDFKGWTFSSEDFGVGENC